MKKSISMKIVILLLFTVILTPNLYAGLNDGLVAYYPFNGNANDASGNANHGTVYGAVQADGIDGNPNSAYKFDGDDDYILVPDSNSLDLTTTFTFAVWIKLDSYAGVSYGGYQPSVVTKAYSNYEPYRIELNDSQTYLSIASSTSYREWPRSNTGVPVNQWTHLAITYNNGNINFYHNGILTGSATPSIETLYTTAGPLYIGARKPSNNTTDGTLDEIRIYNRALSLSEIQELAGISYDVYGNITGDVQEGVDVGLYRTSCGEDILIETTITNSEGYYLFSDLSNGWHTIKPEDDDYIFVPEMNHAQIPQTVIQPYDFMIYNINSGLTAYYPFNGNANDESGTGNNGTVYGASLTTDRHGNSNSAYEFDGADDYIEVADSASLDLTSAFTLSAWIKQNTVPDESTPGSNHRGYRIIDKTTAGGNDGYGFDTHGEIGDTGHSMRLTGPVPSTWSDSDYTLNEFHHLVVVFLNGTASFYLDGVFDGDETRDTTSISVNDLSLRIGYAHPDVNGMEYPTTHFDGTIDDIRIYNRALSPLEITELYNE